VPLPASVIDKTLMQQRSWVSARWYLSWLGKQQVVMFDARHASRAYSVDGYAAG